MLCRVLRVARSAYYAWARRGVSARAQADAALTAQIAAVHARSRRTYGAPRVHAALRAAGIRCARKRVARLMRAAGWSAATAAAGSAPRSPTRPTRPRPNLVARDFAAPAPDRLWLGDITYLPTREGWLYLAVLLDAHSRRVVGWAMADHLRAELALDALAMALAAPPPAAGAGASHRSRLPVHRRGLPGGARRARPRLLDEPVGRVPRQRHGRELLRHPQGRTASTRSPGRRARRRGRRSSSGSRSGTTASAATPRSPTGRPSPLRSGVLLLLQDPAA